MTSPEPATDYPEVSGTVLDSAAAGVARGYAEAMLNAAGAEAGPALEELEAVVAEILVAHPKYAQILASPTLGSAEKDRMLVALLDGKVLPTVMNFLRVLNRHGRLGLLGSVVFLARAILDRKEGRRRVTIRSAAPLDDAQQAALMTRLAGLVGAKPQLKLEVDPSLIAGLVVQVGDDVYDASVRTRLHRLRDRILERKTHEIQSRRDHFSYPA